MEAALPLSTLRRACHAASVPRCVQRRLASLRKDLLLLTSHVRPALLWDYCDVCMAEDNALGGATVTVEQVRILTAALRRDIQGTATLRLLCVGPSLFIVNHPTLHSKLTGELQEPNLDSLVLIAADGALASARFPSLAERESLIAPLQLLGRRLVDALACDEPAEVIQLDGIREAVPRETEGAIRGSAIREVVLAEASIMVALHGWLLDYPIAYCFLQPSEALGLSTCLSRQSLCVFNVSIDDAAEQAGEKEQHGVCSFSCPEELLDEELIRTWWHRLIERFGLAAGLWQRPRLARRTVVENIVL